MLGLNTKGSRAKSRVFEQTTSYYVLFCAANTYKMYTITEFEAAVCFTLFICNFEDFFLKLKLENCISLEGNAELIVLQFFNHY
jgi:hypothetical protein